MKGSVDTFQNIGIRPTINDARYITMLSGDPPVRGGARAEFITSLFGVRRYFLPNDGVWGTRAKSQRSFVNFLVNFVVIDATLSGDPPLYDCSSLPIYIKITQ